ncbi:MAG: NADH-quinone oxidoreductase subunit C [Actinobacteria bacterium]|nr:NADH-quinone oxidoreductase subunit C [Actinomycetota bacterium]MCB8998418.1 NADH-quinone oxidoreductase subunit C [Actinomycetota bacterium]MCB9415629.1 NADH-quinone oxidoreductase subunit C [Actinomycetota bacterium]
MTWREQVRALRDQGFDVLDWLSAVQESHGAVVITACFVRSDQPAEARLLTAPAPVASIADMYPSAVWHERETAEMFEVDFAGHPDPRPLLVPEEQRGVLRKDAALPARLEPWPGAVDPAKPRRVQDPPGTPWR